MCTRYSSSNMQAMRDLLRELGLNAPEGLTPRFNIAPSQKVPVLAQREGPGVEDMVFGLDLPPGTDGKRPPRMLNARAETILSRPLFREATLHRRCLVPASGFFEWERAGATRLPHYFFLPKHPAFFLAGLWERETESSPPAFTVVTTEANTAVRAVHDRMPVILGPNSGRQWLGAEPLEPSLLARLCRPLAPEMMASHRVDPRVNNPRHESPQCIEPI